MEQTSSKGPDLAETSVSLGLRRPCWSITGKIIGDAQIWMETFELNQQGGMMPDKSMDPCLTEELETQLAVNP